MNPAHLVRSLAGVGLLSASLSGCSHPETPADAVVALPVGANGAAPEPDKPARLEGTKDAWVEPVHIENHGIADVEIHSYRVHLPSDAAGEEISRHIERWMDASIASLVRDAEDAASEEDVAVPERPRFSLDIGCAPFAITPSLVSLRCESATFLGGAHDAHVVDVFNFAVDGDTVRPIGIDDLFLDPKLARATLASRCYAELRAQEAMWVVAGNVGEGDLREMLDTFHFERGKLVVTFATYEVGPYAEGEHVVEVPFSSLRGLRPMWTSRLDSIP